MAPVCVLTAAALQCYGISSQEELQHSVHQRHHSFLPISISCGWPNAASIPYYTAPPSQVKSQPACSGGKSADSQHKGKPVSVLAEAREE